MQKHHKNHVKFSHTSLYSMLGPASNMLSIGLYSSCISHISVFAARAIETSL